MLEQINKANLQKLKSLGRRYAPGELYYKIQEKLSAPYQDYGRKLSAYLPSEEELAMQREKQERFPRRPLVSIVVPAYETKELFLRQMIDSVVNQTYPNWELCIADGSSSGRVSAVVLGEYGQEQRIRYRKLKKNDGISENTNQGLAMANGEYIGLLDHDDLLTASALYEMVKRVNDTGADVLYSDEDKVSADLSTYSEPHFKLSFNRELLLGNNYICHFLVVSRKIIEQAKGLDSSFDGAQDYDFVLRCSELAEGVEHIPKILYHWRVHEGSTAGNTDSKLYAYEAGKRAVEAYIRRKQWSGAVSMDNDLGFYHTRYEMPKNITLGVCLWEKQGEHAAGASGFGGKKELPRRLQSFLEQELNSCQANIIWNYDFQSYVDYVLILNPQVAGVEKGSLRILLGSCARPGVGIVGSKTIWKGKAVQCGYWKKDGVYRPRFERLPRHFKGYFRRAYLPVEVDAVGSDFAVLDGKNAAVIRESMLKLKHKGNEDIAAWFSICRQIKEAGSKIIADPGAEVVLHEKA